VNSDSVRALTHAPAAASSRSLSTARAVLRVLSLLVERPSGIRADEVAEALGKSVSTAYYLLTSLCEEGFAVHEAKGVYRPALGLDSLTAAAGETTALHEGLELTVDHLHRRTRKRSYLGIVRPGRIEIVAFRGRQGVPKMPGLGSEIRDNAHALAMGKVVLSMLGPRGLAHYISRGLNAYTPLTITTGDALRVELETVRERGYAVEREEFDVNFCCVAAPIINPEGQFVAALGLSTTCHDFDSNRERLADAVVDIAHTAGRNVPSKPRRRRILRSLPGVS
jgi:DNA-binding IclR family transcriptional regulator